MQGADETSAVRERYARRDGDAQRYSLLNPEALFRTQERQRAIADLFVRIGLRDVSEIRLLEIGCGTGANLLEFLRFGFNRSICKASICSRRTSNVRAACCRSAPHTSWRRSGRRPGQRFQPGARTSSTRRRSSRLCSTPGFQQRLADVMWESCPTGRRGAVVRLHSQQPTQPGCARRSRAPDTPIVPGGRFRMRRVTLAPPLARLVARIHPKLYAPINSCPWLRTHVLAWIGKPECHARLRRKSAEQARQAAS